MPGETLEINEKETTPPEETIIADAKIEADRPALSDLADFLKRTHAVVPLAVIGIFLMGLVGFIYFTRPFLMPVVLALLLSFLLKPVVRFLAGWKIRETFGALIVLLVFFGALAFVISRLTQPAGDWIAKAPETLRAAEQKIHHLLRPAAQISQAAKKVEEITTPEGTEKVTQVEVKQPHLATDLLGYTRSFLAGALETIVLLYFLLAAGDMFMQKIVKVLPTLHDKKKAVEIGNEVQQNISRFLFTITAINTCLGIVVGFSVMLVGMPSPILWGVVAGLLNFIPYFGPITGVAILSVAGLVTFDSVSQALLPPLIYLALHGVEANLVTPMILGRRLTLNPVMIFISLIFWTWIWGIPGALLSIPMLMMLKIFCDHFKPLAPIGEFLGD
ncbi:MAG: AI-2E family transporter [Verrucomicrobiota bacterium]